LAAIAGCELSGLGHEHGNCLMKKLATGLALISLAGMIFGWWGLETVSGRSLFDEMAGIIPMAAGGGAFLLLLIACVLYYSAWR
jgi:hypothetical protein